MDRSMDSLVTSVQNSVVTSVGSIMDNSLIKSVQNSLLGYKENPVDALRTVALVLVGVFVLRLLTRRRLNLPPGPKPWPILGNLPQFGDVPSRSLAELAKTYGPLMFMRLGSKPAVVVSSAAMAKEFLQTQGEVFASRPDSLGARVLGFDNQGIGGCVYGPVLRRLRAILTMELLSAKRLQQFQDVRRDEIASLMKRILDVSDDGPCSNIGQKVVECTNNVVTRMVFSKSYCGLATGSGDLPSDSKEFQSLIQQTTEFGLQPFIGNFIPFLGWFDPTGLRSKMWTLRRRWDVFFDRIFMDHRIEAKQSSDPDRKMDFVDTLLQIHDREQGKGTVTDPVMKSFLKDVLIGGTETAASQSMWTILELVCNLDVQKKLHQELDSVVGRDRFVEESDIPNLPYMQLVVKESFRMHTTLPLLVPHESLNSKPIKVAGYDIPARTKLFVNVSVIHKDPSLWKNPEKFNPERFASSPIDTKGQHFELLPFGSGRRICPGINMGLLMVHFTLAQLVHCFEWHLADDLHPHLLGELEVGRGIVSPKPIPYKVSPRLPLSVYTKQS